MFPVMDPNRSALERAFQLARSGQVSTIDDIRKVLRREGYDASNMYVGPSLRSQLRELIKTAHVQPSIFAKQ
jgi:hypothetical protein